MVLKLLQYQSKMFFMFFFVLGMNQYANDVFYDELIQIYHIKSWFIRPI
jgi:fucose permease